MSSPALSIVPHHRPSVGRPVARLLVVQEGHLFDDIAEDVHAREAGTRGDQLDAERDAHIREARRLIRLARGDAQLCERALAVAEVHLTRAAVLDRRHDQARVKSAGHVEASIAAGRLAVGVVESILTAQGAVDED